MIRFPIVVIRTDGIIITKRHRRVSNRRLPCDPFRNLHDGGSQRKVPIHHQKQKPQQQQQPRPQQKRQHEQKLQQKRQRYGKETSTHQSRTERRKAERRSREKQQKQQQNQQGKGQELSSSSSSSSSSNGGNAGSFSMGRFVPSPALRMPGGGELRSLSSRSRRAWAHRIPPFLLLAFLVSDDDASPYVIDVARGPSMLPTVHPTGDIYLRETFAWHRLLGRIVRLLPIRHDHDHDRHGSTNSQSDSKSDSKSNSPYRVGDVVVWKDVNGTGRYSCKRIVGVEHHVVPRWGEFGSQTDESNNGHKNHDDDNTENNDDNDEDEDDAREDLRHDDDDDGNSESDGTVPADGSDAWRHNRHEGRDQRSRQKRRRRDPFVRIPARHVWLEGDFPPFSVDSRQYGPIPVEWVRGRLMARLWPPQRMGFLSRARPKPPLSVQEALDGPYNFHRRTPDHHHHHPSSGKQERKREREMGERKE